MKHRDWSKLLLALSIVGLVAGATFLSDGVCGGDGGGHMSLQPGLSASR